MKTFIKFFVLVFVLLIIGILVWYYWFNYSMDRLPREEIYISTSSPDGKSNLIIYTNKRSITQNTYIGVVKFKDGNERVIYWDKGVNESKFKVEWVDNENVNINGNKINILTGKYDFRRDKNRKIYSK